MDDICFPRHGGHVRLPPHGELRGISKPPVLGTLEDVSGTLPSSNPCASRRHTFALLSASPPVPRHSTTTAPTFRLGAGSSMNASSVSLCAPPRVLRRLPGLALACELSLARNRLRRLHASSPRIFRNPRNTCAVGSHLWSGASSLRKGVRRNAGPPAQIHALPCHAARTGDGHCRAAVRQTLDLGFA